MAIQTKIKKFLGKCKKPFVCISKITKKHKKESITPSSTTATTTISTTTKEEFIATKEIKVNTTQENTTVTLPERHQQQQQPQQQRQQFITPKEKPAQLDIKPQQQQFHSFSTTKNNYKRYSINNIFNKSKLSPSISAVSPSFVHPVAIKLNVGGMIYMTTQQTLCTYPSYLSELFFLFRSPNSPPSSTYSQYPWPEELFIDRDGELFIHILSFLRNGTLPHSTPLSILQKLEYEAKFYGIKPLQTLLSHRIQIHSSSPKFKVIPIERLSNQEYDFEDGDENGEIAATASARLGFRASKLSASSLRQRQRQVNSDNISVYSSSSSDGSSQEVPIIYNPRNTISNSCNTTTPTTTNYTTPVTRTPKSSTTSNYTTQNNFYFSSAAAQNYNYKPDYEIISITKVPIILNNGNYNIDDFDQMNYLYDDEVHTKELATFVVLQRKDT